MKIRIEIEIVAKFHQLKFETTNKSDDLNQSNLIQVQIEVERLKLAFNFDSVKISFKSSVHHIIKIQFKFKFRIEIETLTRNFINYQI